MNGHTDEFDNGNGVVLNIGIIGAGVAGLTAAAVLSRLGHNVEVSATLHCWKFLWKIF
jgi:NADPH-dependent glutamate synthase beta subunit-like oxidoreductase